MKNIALSVMAFVLLSACENPPVPEAIHEHSNHAEMEEVAPLIEPEDLDTAHSNIPPPPPPVDLPPPPPPPEIEEIEEEEWIEEEIEEDPELIDDFQKR